MANLTEIMTLADSLGSQHVLVAPRRCVSVKNRHSTCTRCADICPTDAITVESNKVTLTHAQCVGCCSCTTVCPTEALVPLAPTDADLKARVAEVRKKTGSLLCFACARMAAKQVADPQRFVEVPCLARVEESLILQQILDGVDRVVLVDGNCKTCKLQVCGPIIQMVVSTSNDLLEARGNAVRVQRVSAFPEEVIDPEQHVMTVGEERRAVLQGSAHSVKGALGRAVGALAKMQASKDSTSAAVLGAMGLTDEKDVLASLEDPQRQVNLLDALYELGQNEDAQVVTRYFGTFSHDYNKCRKCGVCSRVCPTKALRQSRKRVDGFSNVWLEHSASECVQCRLCADICFRECISISPLVSLGSVFSFDLVRFPCSKEQAEREARQREAAQRGEAEPAAVDGASASCPTCSA